MRLLNRSIQVHHDLALSKFVAKVTGIRCRSKGNLQRSRTSSVLSGMDGTSEPDPGRPVNDDDADINIEKLLLLETGI